MMNLHASLTSVCDRQQQLIYRRTGTTTDHIGRFVSIFIREIFEREGLRYDAMHIALAESGIQPLPPIECKAMHFDTRLDRQNAFADALIEEIVADEAIRAGITRLATTLLNWLTVAAPDEHLVELEIDELLACCLAISDENHITNYDHYAALHAHVGACSTCDQWLQAKREAAQARRTVSSAIHKPARDAGVA